MDLYAQLSTVAVTGLHDMDEFVQSQLILAVSADFLFLFLFFWNRILSDTKVYLLLLNILCADLNLLPILHTCAFNVLSCYFYFLNIHSCP